MRYYKNLTTGWVTANRRIAMHWVRNGYKVTTWKEKITFGD